MYILTGLAQATRDKQRRAAAWNQRLGQTYAARRAGNRGGSARRLGDLRVLRGRRAAQAY